MNKFLLLCFLLFIGTEIQSQVTWDGGAGTNNWGDANNWNPNGLPGAAQSVTIGNGFNVILNTNATIASLTVGGGISGSLTLGNNNTNRTLTVTGNVTVSAGAVLQTAGNGGNVVNIGGNLINSGTFDMRIGGATADVNFNGATNQTISGTGTTTDFNLITITNTGVAPNNIVDVLPTNFSAAAGFLTLTQGIIRMSGTYTFTNTFFGAAGQVINADEGIWLNNPNVTVTGQNGDTQLSGLLRITSGTYNIGVGADWWLFYNTGARITVEGGALNISGALVASSATQTINYTQSAGVVTVCTAGNTLAVGSFEIVAAGSSFSMSGGSIVFQNPSAVVSDFINYAATFSVTGGVVQFGNAATPASSVFLMEGTAPVFDLTVNTTNTPTLQFATSTTVLRDITIGGILDADAFDQTMNVGRNWINNGTFTAGTGTITFNSTAQAQTIGGSSSSTFYNLTNTNTNSTGVSLLINTTVSNVLSLSSSSNGRLTIGTNNLTISSGGSITGANTTRYIVSAPTTASNGRLRQNNLPAAARLYPVGTAVYYLPATVTPASAGTDFSVSVFTGTTTNGLPGGPAFGNRAFQANVVWRVDRISGSSNAQVRFDWLDVALEGSNFTSLPNASIGIYRNDGSGWALIPNPTTFLNDNSANFSSTTTSPVTNFGTAGTGFPFIVANVSVLPSALKSFAASEILNGNLLVWELENPERFKVFEVEESTNGINFSFLTAVNTNTMNEYSYRHITDKSRKNFYRLKLIDLSGNITYSHIVSVGGKKQLNIVLLQNPVQNQLVFRHPEARDAGYSITDMNGRVVLRGVISRNAVMSTINTTSLSYGLYTLSYYNNEERFVQAFMKQ
jgi:hypothetical protein